MISILINYNEELPRMYIYIFFQPSYCFSPFAFLVANAGIVIGSCTQITITLVGVMPLQYFLVWDILLPLYFCT